MGKKFYFARSKIDNDLQAEKRRRGFDEKATLAKIRENCMQGEWLADVIIYNNDEINYSAFPVDKMWCSAM